MNNREIMPAIPEQNDSKHDEKYEIASGTIMWLFRNGVITGNSLSDTGSHISSAQLSAKALLVLLRETQTTFGYIKLGDAVVRWAAKDTSDASDFAEFLVREVSSL